MKNNFKVRLISVSLCFAMALVFSVPSWALGDKTFAEVPNEGVYEQLTAEEEAVLEEEEAIEEIEEMFEETGFDVVSEEVNDDGQTIITTEFEGIESEITVTEATDENVVMDIVEGDLENTLEIKDDGSVLVDGKEVVVETVSDSDGSAIETPESEGDIVADAQGKSYSTTSCPYGKSGDYTKLLASNQYNLKFGESFSKIAFLTFYYALAICPPLFGVLTAAREMYDELRDNKIKSDCLGLKWKKYAYKGTDGWVTKKKYVTKNHMEYYANGNCSGSRIGVETTYNVVEMR